MDPKHHPIEKENHHPSSSIFGFQPLIFQGVNQTSRMVPQVPAAAPPASAEQANCEMMKINFLHFLTKEEW